MNGVNCLTFTLIQAGRKQLAVFSPQFLWRCEGWGNYPWAGWVEILAFSLLLVDQCLLVVRSPSNTGIL